MRTASEETAIGERRQRLVDGGSVRGSAELMRFGLKFVCAPCVKKVMYIGVQ
ncbi:hypothetical protein ACFXKK_02560 [Streptomyces globisporus]|uniref:hypothetical protein n=1 Tax=Streptomyces globisporus TaxID=1908 RepID=UPI0036583CBC